MHTSLLALGSTLQPFELQAAMNEYDQNDDHMIDFEEFKSIIQKDHESDFSRPAEKVRHKTMMRALDEVSTVCS